MGFDSLIKILADLYPTPEDARRIVAQAGIDHRHINFSGSAMRFWSDIFVVADRTDRVFALLAVVEDEYGDNAGYMHQSRMYYRDMAQLKSEPLREYEELDMPSIIEKRMDSAEDDIRDLKKLQSEMLGEMRSLNRMLETLLTGGNVSVASVSPSPWLFASMVAIMFLVGIILYFLANGGA